jgi:methyl-accepting chemotaxis protein WspA
MTEPNPKPRVEKKHQRLARRLLFWFLLIALLPCGILTAITGRLANRALETSVQKQLVQIASARSIQLESYAAERVRDGTTLSIAPTVVTAISQLSSVGISGSDSRKVLDEKATAYAPYLRDVATSRGYQSLLLIDVNGTILYSSTEQLEPGATLTSESLRNTELARGFDRSRTLLQSELCKFAPFGKSGNPTAFVTSPIFQEEKVVGVRALQLPIDHVWQILTDTTGLGATGEILTAERMDNIARITTPLRHRTDAAFELTIPLTVEKAIAARNASSGNRGYAVFPDYRKEEVAAAWCYLPSYRWGLVAKQDTSEAFALVRFQQLLIAGLLCGTVLVVVVVALFVARSISTPIQRAIGLSRKVAAGDLREDVSVSSRDETAILLESLQTMTRDLRMLIARVHTSSDALTNTSSKLQTTGANQQHVIKKLGDSTTQTVAAVEEISVTGKELTQTMVAVNEMAGQTGAMAIEGRENLSSMDDTMRKLADSTGSFGSRLAVINERATTINLAVTTIAKVADQTNLLSINAAIEAEKAGEYGLGFLVIAREIRRLADQTAVASLEIEKVVKEMQLSVSSGVMEMDAFTKSVETGAEEIGGVSRQLAEIITSVKGISERFEQVAEGMQAQSQGAEQIRIAMSHLAESVSESESALESFQNATTDVQQAANDLHGEITHFKL